MSAMKFCYSLIQDEGAKKPAYQFLDDHIYNTIWITLQSFVDDVMGRNYDVITIQNIFVLRRPRVAIFADIIRIITIFCKTIFKDLKMLKELEIIYENAIYIRVSWYRRICWSLVKNCWCELNARCESRVSYIFWIFTGEGICVAEFQKGRTFLVPLTHPWAASKRLIRNRVDAEILSFQF